MFAVADGQWRPGLGARVHCLAEHNVFMRGGDIVAGGQSLVGTRNIGGLGSV